MAKSTNRTIYINGKEAEYTFKGLTSLANRFKNEMKNAEIGTEKYSEALKGLKKTYEQLEPAQRQLQNVSKSYSAIQQGLSGIAGYAAAAFAVDNVISFAKQSLTVANNIEQTSIAFETMLGSKAAADKLQADLIALAAKTPFELSQVQDTTKQLLAYGFSAKEVIPTLTELGNIAGGVGMEKLPQLTLAFGQVRAATRLTGNELRQFTEAGVPLLEELSKVLKKPVAEIQKMISDGKVGFKDVEQALTNLTTGAGRFAGLMEKQSQSLGGLWSTFKDNFTQNVLLPIGQGLTPVLKKAMSIMSEFAGTSSKFDAMAKSVEKERVELTVLVARIQHYNVGSTERNKLIDTLQKQYPSFLGNLNAEKATNEQLGNRLQEVNKQYIAKAMAIQFSKKIEQSNLQEAGSVDVVAKAQYRQLEMLAKARSFLGNQNLSYSQAEAKLQDRINQGVGLFAEERNVLSLLKGSMLDLTNAEFNHGFAIMSKNKVTKEQLSLLEELKKIHPEIAKEIDDIMNPKSTPDITGGGTPDGISEKEKTKAQKRIEHEKATLQKLKENLVNYQNDIAQLNDSEQKEELKIAEKYQKQITEAQKLYQSKDREVRLGAHDLVKELETLKAEELLALTDKHLKEINTLLEKNALDVAEKAMTTDEREIDRIKRRYEKYMALTLAVEQDTQFASEGQRAKAHAFRLQLEKQRQDEIDIVTQQRVLENQAKADKQWQDKQLAQATKQDAEVLEVVFHYQNLFDTQKLSEEERAAMVEEMEKRIGEIRKKYREEDVKEEKNKAVELLKLLEEEKKAKAELEITKLKAAESGFGLMRQYLDKNSALAKAFFAVEKGIAVAQVIKNLQIEVSALRAAATLQLLSAGGNPVAMAAIEGIKIARIQIARINAGVGIATIAAQTVGELVVPQKYEGGYTTVIGQQDGKRYTPQYIGSPNTGLLNYANPVLVQSATGQNILGNEKGVEYFVSNKSLQNPQINYLTHLIDNIHRFGSSSNTFPAVSQREGGGYTANSQSSTLNPEFMAAIQQNTQVNQRLLILLSNGIQSQTIIGFPEIKQISDSIDRVKSIQG